MLVNTHNFALLVNIEATGVVLPPHQQVGQSGARALGAVLLHHSACNIVDSNPLPVAYFLAVSN